MGVNSGALYSLSNNIVTISSKSQDIPTILNREISNYDLLKIIFYMNSKCFQVIENLSSDIAEYPIEFEKLIKL